MLCRLGLHKAQTVPGDSRSLQPKGLQGKIRKSWGADDPGQEGAPNSVLSAVAMCLGH